MARIDKFINSLHNKIRFEYKLNLEFHKYVIQMESQVHVSPIFFSNKNRHKRQINMKYESDIINGHTR